MVYSAETPPEQDPDGHEHGNTAKAERTIVFMGGLGYDRQRNLEVGNAIMRLADYQNTLVIEDASPGAESHIVVHRYADGSERELPGKVALKHVNADQSEVRFTKLHQTRAQHLIAAIDQAGGKPVDAVFQSVDVSTGILAMHERPELFDKVVLLDPSSIIKLPGRKQYLQEEWRNGNLVEMLRRKKDLDPMSRFETRPSIVKRVMRTRRTGRHGNKIASYVSSQAAMLHEIAQSKHAPDLMIIASQFDHAYSPARILQSLVSLDDVKGFFVTNMRHGLGGKQVRLEQLVDVLGQAGQKTASFTDNLHFFKGVSDDYRQKLLDIVAARTQK